MDNDLNSIGTLNSLVNCVKIEKHFNDCENGCVSRKKSNFAIENRYASDSAMRSQALRMQTTLRPLPNYVDVNDQTLIRTDSNRSAI